MPRQSPPSQPQQPSELEPAIWQACAGPSVEIPKPNSMVYYFPQGHFDQASSAPKNLSSHLLAKPFIICSVVSVNFLADPLTDEVFTKMVLQPVGNNLPVESFHTPAFAPPAVVPPAVAPPPNDDNEVVSFAKILTPSDANNGGGFSVPRFCADSVFPKLNFGADPPVQNLSVTDVHGFTWEFRHIYRGTPRRHLLTTGWSTFVNNKKLVAGDSVLFMKHAQRLFVGIRRATRFSSERANCPKLMLIEEEEDEEEDEEDEEKVKRVFKRDGKGKLTAKVVVEAAELAARQMQFEVVYYPKAGWSEFVVKIEVVDAAMRIAWSEGMRVKMSVETDDSSRMTWFQGTVSAVSSHNNGQWCSSPWRMLQVTWDEPEGPRNGKWVSPWQVELVSPPPVLHPAFPPAKRLRTANGYGVMTNGEGGTFSVAGVTNSAMVQLNPAYLGYSTFPAGMQGARHDVFSASSFPSYPRDLSHVCIDNSFGNNTFSRQKNLPTELHVGGNSQSDELSPDSSFHSCVTDTLGNTNNSIKPAPDSFQLFGAVIRKEQPVQNDLTGDKAPGR
ncbi:auxin response factor 17 [Vigna umbellata]|uniref:auxin response factor 17 n=1 Tax=Vigna umbellata TaxID=87088 RepID=UPI001F5EA828|nr:auxin response factor 17 [Vigna umbellata]